VRTGCAGKMRDMREVTRTVLIARPAAMVYRLINDIERYPEFVPGCAAARVLSSSDVEIVATLSIKRGPLQMDFTTRNVLDAPNAIQLQLEDGPFDELRGSWQLTPLSDQGCRATLILRFAFDNPVTGLVLEPLFENIVTDLVDAFVLRARQLPAVS
jgi:ribosome-associated toxin RatA of RatAB toxin-antitoxin module